MFYGGMTNVPGAPGNLMAGGPSFDINRTPGALGGRSGEQLRRLYEGGTQQNEKLNEELRRRGIMPGAGPQLPMAFGSSNLPGAVGNMGGMEIAQAQGFNFLNPLSWFQGKPQEAIRDAERGVAPQGGSGSLAEQMLRRRAEQERALQLLRQ